MVELAQDERDELEAVLKSSTHRAVSATKLQRARIMLDGEKEARLVQVACSVEREDAGGRSGAAA